MKKNRLSKAHCWFAFAALSAFSPTFAADGLSATSLQTSQSNSSSTALQFVEKKNEHSFVFRTADNKDLTVDFYGENIVRFFLDKAGASVRRPVATPDAVILVEDARKKVGPVAFSQNGQWIQLRTASMALSFDTQTGNFSVEDLRMNRQVLRSLSPIATSEKASSLTLSCAANEYFYGGGVQNGRFSHRGRRIAIENTNNWVDGGVASPTPFYWSTAGYGILWHSFKKGAYDFGASKAGQVHLEHDEAYADFFVMVNEQPVALLNDFYQLTGHPVLLPKFAFYQGHLNAYNRDYWTEAKDGKGFMRYEDGKTYNESQKDNGGIKESLNGEKNNYQFSARAAIDRYDRHDMPLGWFLPNDGYGAGYGQTGSIDGNIENLRQFGDYAREKGVELGLWTQSDLYPKAGIEPLLQRDIIKEVGLAGVRVLKTDVAWVGAGYSFGLNGCADVAKIMPQYGNNARPFILSLDGWAGTQRYASIWSGDQTGGEWEYIRFHIPTFIGSGLSGQPNISSDTDGIFGGKNPVVNVREFQWKAFNPLGLNMDGWGSNPKYPEALGGKTTALNRWYLKLKSEILPYTYAAARTAVNGKPLIRPMFMEETNDYTLGRRTQYQYMYGDAFLVAPVYQNTAADSEGNDRRDGIYLPQGTWVDYFTGDSYEGNVVLNYFDAPLWKLPVLVKADAIIGTTRPNNNAKQLDARLRAFEIYAQKGGARYQDYDDDGRTEAYREGAFVTTDLNTHINKDRLSLHIDKAYGHFEGFEAEKRSELTFNVTQSPKAVKVKINGKRVKLRQVKSLADWETQDNVWYYEARPQLNRWVKEGEESVGDVFKNPQVKVRLAPQNVATTSTEVLIEGFHFAHQNQLTQQTGKLFAPQFDAAASQAKAYSLTPAWTRVDKADYYEVEFDGQRYTNIRDTHFTFDQLEATTTYDFRVRAVNAEGESEWKKFQYRTVNDPLEWAIKGARAITSVSNQGSQGTDKLLDHDTKTTWHTSWSNNKALPFDLLVDLRARHELERLVYVPREHAGNGTLLRGTYSLSSDRHNWTKPVAFVWERNDAPKQLDLPATTTARYVKFHIEEAVGGFGSGQELFVFRRPNTDGELQGDINRDRKVDDNDFTSFMNYTGLRKTDADFDYVAAGDLNQNGLIDAYDIAHVAVELDNPLGLSLAAKEVSGKIELLPSVRQYKAGEVVELRVWGKDLKAVNALSFALPYDADELEYLGTELKGMQEMSNLTYDRLHSNGQKVLYPTFVNRGQRPTIDTANAELFVLRFRAKKAGKFSLRHSDGLLVDRNLGVQKF